MLDTLDKPSATSSAHSTKLQQNRINELLKRIQSRDQKALEDLIKLDGAFIRNVVRNGTCFDEHVDDVLQHVYLHIWDKADQFDPAKGEGMAWIITLARRRAIDFTRRSLTYRRYAELHILESQRAPQSTGRDSVETEADESDKMSQFDRVFAQIPTAQAAVVRMAFIGGLSQREIAKKLNLPLGTVKTRIELGVRKVRGSLLAIASKTEWLPSRYQAAGHASL